MKNAFAESPVPASPETITLDVRPILARGDTPCAAIDAAVAQVELGHSLILLAPFEPVPLYTKLARQGFEASPQSLGDGLWQVEFRRTANLSSTPAAQSVSCGCHAH